MSKLMRNKNRSRIAVCIILAFLVWPGCGSRKDTGDEITIIFWHSLVSASLPALNELVEKYEAEHPGVQIKPQYVPTGDALSQKLITAILSETAPDISWIHSDFLEDLIKADAIYPMEHFLASDTTFNRDVINDIYPPLVTYASWRNTLYCMPMEATNIALIYNKDIFRANGLDPEHPPETWDELLEYNRILTKDSDGDGKFEQVGFFVPIFPASGPLGGWMVWQFYPFLWQAGGFDFLSSGRWQAAVGT